LDALCDAKDPAEALPNRADPIFSINVTRFSQSAIWIFGARLNDFKRFRAQVALRAA
jgi:hypothetical protein